MSKSTIVKSPVVPSRRSKVGVQTGASGSPDLTTATLEVLACIAFKQPISQSELDHLFAADKRGLVVKLRDLRLVEEFAGADGRLRFATTEAFLQRFNLVSLQELTVAAMNVASPSRDNAKATLRDLPRDPYPI